MISKYKFRDPNGAYYENPVVARFVDHEEEYPYSSAIDYSGQKGLVEIVKMY